MKDAIHKKQIKWPVLITENIQTGKFTAVLKGVDGVIAQGDTNQEVIDELKISLASMLKYFEGEAEEIVKTQEHELGNKLEQSELFMELC